MGIRLPFALATAALLAAAVPAAATPVKCAAGDVTPEDRVFPEAMLSTNFLRFDEFQCAIRYLESRFPERIQVTEIGRSAGGRPLYDVLVTDETVKGDKEELLVLSSIHGDEVGGREGGTRTIEDIVDSRFAGDDPRIQRVLDEFVIHFQFPNPDGWVKGDVTGSPNAGTMATRGNDNGTDLNRELPVKGWINATKLTQPEGRALRDSWLAHDDWYLGTDNHGQLHDTYAAAGLQIVGEFDYQKSETLARFADGITQTMKEHGFGLALETLRETSGQDLGAYHWGTLYDMLGYSASGSGIDYYNTPGVLDGTGFATELTVGREVNWLAYPAALNQVWVDAIRAINLTMFRQAVDRREFTFPVGGRTAYVFDDDVIAHDDANGPGFKAGGVKQEPYEVSRMKFFEDLDEQASRRLERVVPQAVTAGNLGRFDSVVLANGPLPADDGFYEALGAFVRDGGNLVLTDAAAKALPELGVGIPASSANRYVGYVDFLNRTDALNQGLRGVASQTYDTVPIGYRFGSNATSAQNSAPNWTVDRTAWEAAGGRTAGTNGGRTIYGELPLGKGRIRFLGALLPDPTEAFDHRYGLQNYAVTYTGYTLLQNMLAYTRPAG